MLGKSETETESEMHYRTKVEARLTRLETLLEDFKDVPDIVRRLQAEFSTTKLINASLLAIDTALLIAILTLVIQHIGK